MGKALVIGQASSKVLAPFFGYILLPDLSVRNDAACHKIIYKNRQLVYLYGALKKPITADLTIRLNAIVSGTTHVIGTFTIPQSTALDTVLEWSGSDFAYTNCPHKSTLSFDITASDGQQFKDGIAEFLLVLTPSDSGEGAPSSAPGTVTHTLGSLTSGEPVVGNGTGDATVGSRSGDTTEFVTTTGAHPSGHGGEWDANGNWIDSGAPPVTLPIAESDVTGLVSDLAAKVPSTRQINTTAPLTGGGDLSADRTIAISAFTGDSGSGGAKGAVPAPAAGDSAAGKYLAAGGGWSVPPTVSPATAVPLVESGSGAVGTGTKYAREDHVHPASSPLTTKGDLYGHSTVDARVPVGSDGQVLTADSTQALGVKWAAAGTTLTPQVKFNTVAFSYDYIMTFNSYVKVDGTQLWP